MATHPLTFDTVTHTYRVGDRVLPSVTHILATLSDGYTPDDEYARDLGTRVHATTAALDRRQLVDPDFDVEPYLTGYRTFLRAHHTTWVRIETPAWHPVLGYAGTVDRIGYLNGYPTVLDIKSGSSIPDYTALQLAAYDLLFPVPAVRRRLVLHLGAATYRLREYTDPSDYNAFLRLVRTYHERSHDGPDHPRSA